MKLTTGLIYVPRYTMKIVVITAPGALSRIWNHVAKVSSHDVVPLLKSEFRSSLFTPRLAGWRKLMRISPDCIWVDQHNIEGFYTRLFQVYGHEHVPVIGYLRGDIWTEVADSIAYIMEKRRKKKKEKSSNPKKSIEESAVASFYSGSLPFVLAFKFHFSFLRDLSMGQYDLLVCISKWLEERAHQEMPKMPTDVWNIGVDPSPFLNAEEMGFAHPCVGILQSHSYVRKVDALLKFASVVEALPDIHFYVSEGVSRWSEFLPQVKETLGKFRNVHFLRVMPHEAPIFLRSVDCYALVTGLDAFPSTIREAQLACTPVVASRVCGVEESLGESPWNAALDNDDTEQWVKTLREFTKGKGQNRKGHEYVVSTFRWEVAVQEFEKICVREVRKKSSMC
jgi:glycosyltransferase involved in cell wall biosynthesis